MAWDWLAWTALFLASYLIGGIPTAYLAARILKGQDIRDLGDRNAGAANVFRNVGARAGMFVGVIDIAKGAAAVLLAKLTLESAAAEMIAGVLAVAGHNWPIYLRLRGGRGAAPAVGVLLSTFPLLLIPAGITALVVLWLTRKAIASLGFFLILAAVLSWCLALAPVPERWTALQFSYAQAGYALFIPVMVGFCHVLSLRRPGG